MCGLESVTTVLCRRVLLLSVVIVAAGVPVLRAANSATKAFQKMQSLAGDWEGKDDSGNVVSSNFNSVASGTAVLETLKARGMEEMLTLYSVDNGGIALMHYCPTNNQPQMRAVPPDGEIKELVFEFQRAGNLPNIDVGHEHKLVLQFENKDHITERWTWRRNGQDTEMVYHLTRAGRRGG